MTRLIGFEESCNTDFSAKEGKEGENVKKRRQTMVVVIVINSNLEVGTFLFCSLSLNFGLTWVYRHCQSPYVKCRKWQVCHTYI